ncbi:MAG: hypothetical protein LKF82_13725 [Acinetobacter populi]|jgi:archaellum component FlaG (FlaF/FlaG flagellin family)|uniref:hypothetical protein n=1 Tax=Acinetobacter populi TaxID=1582270 RepID=UPI0023559AC0|nr:hypothetical protein [Acinetobacter populi]MCH4248865.1 hypothetical protein [Acinetobacter populi]
MNKEILLIIKNLILLIFIWLIAVLIVASCSNESYAKDLSNSLSDSSHRKSDFFVPVICIDPQSIPVNQGTSVTATLTRLQSVYDGMTSQNKAVMPNMWGESKTSRVNPVTSIFTGDNIKTQNVLGGNHA